MERATREVRMICTLRMIRWERIDMCTVVPYEYMAVGGVLNGLIYLILSSPTRVDAIWRALRPFKEGWNFLPESLSSDTAHRAGLYACTDFTSCYGTYDVVTR